MQAAGFGGRTIGVVICQRPEPAAPPAKDQIEMRLSCFLTKHLNADHVGTADDDLAPLPKPVSHLLPGVRTLPNYFKAQT
jgi:hypothetical protein